MEDTVAKMVANSPIFPPSFDGNPVLFALALFARSLILAMALATIVRLTSISRAEGVSKSSPIYYHRLSICLLMTAAALGAGSDVLVWLLWGEASEATMTVALTVSKVMDTLTIGPFLLALFVPYWMLWLRKHKLLVQPIEITVKGVAGDLRATWTSLGTPLTLLFQCGVGSAAVAAVKWYSWVGHASN